MYLRMNIACFATAAMLAMLGNSQEQTAYSYDVHGRLTQVVRVNASGPDSTSAYAYDPADNRTSRTITVTASRTARGDGPTDPGLLLVDPTGTPPVAPDACAPPDQPTTSSPACVEGKDD